MTRLVAGCMTGTSIDALDVALVRIAGQGLGLRARVERCCTHALGPLANPLRRLAAQAPMTAGEIAHLSHEFALLHARALRELAANDTLDLVCVHGQTVFHAPPASWQLMHPAPIAAALGVPVVFDLRAADLAAGGQGAPITPLADYILFRTPGEARAIVNLGGYCNYTLLPPAPSSDPIGPADHAATVTSIRGGDICACNHVLDEIARRVFGVPFDEDGRRALAGRSHAPAYAALCALLQRQADSGRSLGTGDEVADWIAAHRIACSGEDLARSACDAIATVIAGCLPPAMTVLVAGGGVRNQALLYALRERCRGTIATTDDAGVPSQYREAAAMAVLGALCQDGVPITLPAVTGVAVAPVAGAWVYPPGM